MTALRATARRGLVQAVRPRNGARKLYRAVTRKTNPLKIESMEDVELLAVILPADAARNVAAYLKPHGGLRAFVKLGEGGPRNLLALAGVDEGSAARILVLWELSARISEPYRVP